MNKETIKLMRQLIKEGRLSSVKELLNENEDLLDVDTVFGSWLHVAADHGKKDIVRYLIECGIDINRNGGISGGNALHSAARHGYMDIISILYTNGAKLDTSEAAKNPLFAAICNGHLDIVEFLVEKGIDLKACYPIGELENVDAYEYARQYGQTEIANYLKSKME